MNPRITQQTRARAPSGPLDLTTLRVVIAVAESGSISAGSDHAGLAIGAVSTRIAALEAELGVRLFERSSRGVRLTAAGHLLVQRGREVLADADRLTLDLLDYGQGRQGHVRMLSNASAIIEFLPQQLETFKRSHPLIRVEVEERSSPEIPLALLEGRADLGIVDIPHPIQGLTFAPLFRDELVLIVAGQHPLAQASAVRLQEMLNEDFICLPDGNAISGRLVAAAAMLGQSLAIHMQMRSFDAVCRMVANGVGVSILPRQAIGPQLAVLPLRAVSLAEPWAQRIHQLAWREDLAPLSSTRALLRVLRETPAI
ncbi:MAG: LysR family transcriptional regulator [Burkholderiales bacterium]|nr:LysR family transcriptional regulator [Burkholderiales bacterium]MBK8666389.1 LysR family transcriptional regulator [Burkholderiales bacterium]